MLEIIVISILVIILLVIILNKKIQESEINLGEKEVKNILNKIEGYKLINDIMIKTEKGTSQIDHILIGRKGIFVIETKDYNGLIYGEEYSKYWTQVLNKRSNDFYNPIRQNYGHIKSLERCLKRKNIFISVIVFTNKSNLKIGTTETTVIQSNKLKKFIKKYNSDIKLSKNEIIKIYNIIKKSNIQSSKVRKKHIEEIIKNIS